MGDRVVANITTASNGTRFDYASHLVLVAAMTRNGWGTRAEFIGRYSHQPLPERLTTWTGEAELLDPAHIGQNVRLQTPFGILEPIYPLNRRTFWMPKVER